MEQATVVPLPGRDVLERAIAFARWAYRTEDDRALERAWESASQLAAAGCEDTVIAAGLLAGILEETSVGASEIAASVSAEVAELVLTDGAALRRPSAS